MKLLSFLLFCSVSVFAAEWAFFDLGPTTIHTPLGPGSWTSMRYVGTSYTLTKTENMGKTYSELGLKFASPPYQFLKLENNKYLLNSTYPDHSLNILNEKNETTKILQHPLTVSFTSKDYIVGIASGDLILNREPGNFNRWEIISAGTKITSTNLISLNSEKLAFETEKGVALFDLKDKKLNFIPGIEKNSGTLFKIEDQLFYNDLGGVFYQLKNEKWELLELKASVTFYSPNANYANVHISNGLPVRLKLEKGKLILEDLVGLPSLVGTTIATSFEKEGVLYVMLSNGRVFYQKNPVLVKIAIEGEGTIKINVKDAINSKTLRIKNSQEVESDFFSGDTLEVEAIPNKGMRFVGWFDDPNKLPFTETKKTFKVTEKSLSIKASFEKE